jgi:hypothetical protein
MKAYFFVYYTNNSKLKGFHVLSRWPLLEVFVSTSYKVKQVDSS